MPATIPGSSPGTGMTYSTNAVAGEFLCNVRLNRFRGDNVEIAPGGIVVLDLGNAAAIERGCPFRLDPQRCIIVGNGFTQLPGFQGYHGAAVTRGPIARAKLQAHVAILKHQPKITDGGAPPP